jgi:hypothetical protein
MTRFTWDTTLEEDHPLDTEKERSKRQERVGHLVRTELSQIIHTGLIKGDPDFLEAELRKSAFP